jgi:glycosyltransferase involved in cell wall biosynthesis
MALSLLFVTHSLHHGGAIRSLRGLIANYQGITCDLVVPHRAAMTDDEARAYFGPNVRRIVRFWLPFELCYRGRPALWRYGHRWIALRLLWLANRAAFYRLAAGYDAIHLNSIVLHPIVRAELPFVIHVREIVDLDLAAVRGSVCSARGTIFIDEATRTPFRDLELRSLVLNNPIDMSAVDAPPADAAARLGAALATLTIFSIIGVLIPEKGIDRVIRAFRATRDPQLRLVIVGEGFAEAALRELARGDPRITFWGFTRDVEPLFAMSDYVLRGEAYPCVGRTIYEALYAGCAVIIPGPGDAPLFEYERFATRIHFYPPGDETRLRATFESLAGKKLGAKRGGTNVAEHVAGFDRFIRAMTTNRSA